LKSVIIEHRIILGKCSRQKKIYVGDFEPKL
jgi:hypothetical protein